MNLIVNLPADLEASLKKRAEQAGIDLSTYVLQMLRTEELSQPTNVSDEQFAASLERLRTIHKAANPHFDDSRDSIYSGRGE